MSAKKVKPVKATAKAKPLKSAESEPVDAAAKSVAQSSVTEESHYSMVAEAAYYRALQRGFQGGSPEDDWYAAEAEIQRVSGQRAE
jgi:hypothetical protein